MDQGAAYQSFHQKLRRRRKWGTVFAVTCGMLSLVGLVALGLLIARVLDEGWAWLTWRFVTNYPSQLWPEESGIRSALFGSLWLVAITALVSVPIGIGAAIYLEEYAPHNRLTRLIHLNIANLAGVPSIVYGILGLAVFVRYARLDRSVIAGGLTLSLLILPVIIIASREAIVAVPSSFRQAAFALGATRWQTVWAHVLPNALPGIMTGIILAVSRALGEAAPLIVIGATTYIAFTPDGLKSMFTALPIQIFMWSEQPQIEFQYLAAAGILVLLGVLLPLNLIAVMVRAWHQKRKVW